MCGGPIASMQNFTKTSTDDSLISREAKASNLQKTPPLCTLCKRKMCLGHGDVREYGAKTQKQENGKTRKRLWTPWKRDATGAARKREYGQTTRKRENGENAKTAKTAKISLPVKVSYMFTLPLLGRGQIRFNLMRVSISFYFNGNIENLLLPHDGIARADWNFWKSWHSHHMGFCHKSIPGR